MNLEFHEIANLFPLIEGDEFEELVEDIDLNGMQQPILMFEGKILDGRNRYRAACRIAEERNEPEHYYYFCDEYTGDDPQGLVLSLNLHRRHLSESQRAMVAAELLDGNENLREVDIIKEQDLSRTTVHRAKKVIRKGIEKLKQKVKNGDLNVTTASRISDEPKNKQAKIIEDTEQVKKYKGHNANKKHALENQPITLHRVEMVICNLCLGGYGGECATPGCAMIRSRGPDVPITDYTELETVDTKLEMINND